MVALVVGGFVGCVYFVVFDGFIGALLVGCRRVLNFAAWFGLVLFVVFAYWFVLLVCVFLV